MEQTHKIQQCIFETSFDSEHNAFEFQQQFSDFVNNKLMLTIESSLNKYDIEDNNIQIDEICLDIGKLSYHDFENDMEIRVKNELERILSEKIKHSKNYTEEAGVKIEPQLKSEINYLEIFLNTGSVPWQYKNSGTYLAEIFSRTVKNEPAKIAQMLERSQNLNLTVKRIIKQFGFSKVEALVQFLETKLQIKIQQLVSSLNLLHQKLGFSNKSNAIFADTNHELFLSELIKHHTKNTSEKEFINIYLHQLSVHLDIDFTGFVKIIHSNLTAVLTNNSISKTIKNHIEVIYSEISVSDNKILKDNTVLPERNLPNQLKADYNEIRRHIDKKNPQSLRIDSDKISVVPNDNSKTNVSVDITDSNVVENINTNSIEELFNSMLEGAISKNQFNKNLELQLNKPQQVLSSLQEYAAKGNFISRFVEYLSDELFEVLLKTGSQNMYSVYTKQCLLVQNYFLINNQEKPQLNQKKYKSFALMLLLGNNTEALSKDEILKTYIQSVANELKIDFSSLITQTQNNIQLKLSDFSKNSKGFKDLHELNNSLNQFKNIKTKPNFKNSSNTPISNDDIKNEIEEEIKDSIYIQNAGLILIHPFISSLFQRLELLNGIKFKGIAEQERAVLILQYIVNGQINLPEYILPLNKILCGLPIGYPVANNLVLNEKEKELIDSLLSAIIQQWRAIGNSSINGLRESFLQREGKLVSEEKNWKLLVDQKSYDMLLDQLPWSYTLIKLAWMKKAIVTSWRA